MSAEGNGGSRGVRPAGQPLSGLVFTRQFPNASEPYRGTFVEQQMLATASEVAWRALVPTRWVPMGFERLLGRPRVAGRRSVNGIDVTYSPYPVLPRRLLYLTVAPAMAACSASAFRSLARERGVDLIHAHELYPSGAAAARLARTTGTPLVVSVHGSDLYSNLVNDAWRDALIDVARSADALVCVGTLLAEDVARELGADPARIHVVPDCFDESTFTYIDRGSPVDRPVRILTVGRLVPEKGFDLLLRALAALISRGRKVSLRIVGGGTLRSELEALTAELGLEEHVTFLGAQPTASLRDEYATADLYVQPSRREGFGLALVEAMATGLPAVATASGGPSDIMSPVCGVLVEPEDVDALESGLSRALDSLPAYDSKGISALMSERYSRRAVGGALVDVYRSVVG